MWTQHVHFPSCTEDGAARALALVLCGVLGLSSLAFGQQTSSPSKKILTLQQQASRQQMQEVWKERGSLRAQARQAFDAEMSQEKAGDCVKADNTYASNTCYEKAVGVTDQNLKTYAGAIRDLLGLKYPDLSGQPPMPGIAGPVLTPEQSVAEFDHVEQVWHSYLDTASTAAFHQFGGGTGGPSFEMESHLQLVRSHMRELDAVYGMLLRL